MAFGLEEMYGDGGSLFAYLGGNTWGRFDAGGLSWDPFTMVDEFMAEDMGSKKAFLEGVIGGAHTVAYVGSYLAANLPFAPGPIALVGEVGLLAMDEPEILRDSQTWQQIKAIEGFASSVGDALDDFMSPISLLSSAAGAVSDIIDGTFSMEDFAYEFAGRWAGGDEDEWGDDDGPVMAGSRINGKTARQLRKWIRKTKGDIVRVYAIVDKDNSLQEHRYFGVSNDLVRRGREHGHVELKPIGAPLPRNLARAVETYLMERHGTLGVSNRKRSLSPKRPFSPTARMVAEKWLAKHASSML
jgi:hypothetical protein